jgi:glc operon protein GlcG
MLRPHRWLLAMAATLGLILAFCPIVSAQAPVPYGEPISLESAKKVIAAAEVEAKKNNWPVAIAIVDSSGYLVAFHRLDNTQLGSVEVALKKAKTSALFRRPTKAFEDVLAMGGANVKVVTLPEALPIEGGLPIVHNGKIIGAIGVSGVKSTEDAQIATAGLEALKPMP